MEEVTVAVPSEAQRAKRITAAEIDVIESDLGDRMYVLVTLEDGEKFVLLKLPVGRLHLEPRSLVGRSVDAAYGQAMCWLEAADTGLHRIIGIEKIGPIAEEDPERSDLHGNAEVVARMSDGSVVRVFAFYDNELSFGPTEFLDLSLSQARRLKLERDAVYLASGYRTPDYSEVYRCLLCPQVH